MAVVPRSALRSENGAEYVWRISNGALERRAVGTAGTNGRNVEITAGIAPGDRVVVASNIELENGKKVDDL